MGRRAEQECSDCRETPAGSAGNGNGKMDGGGRDREKDKASLRGGQTIFLSLGKIKANIPAALKATVLCYLSACLCCRPDYTDILEVK